MEENRDFTALLTRKCKRKEVRKTKKKLSVMCRVAFTKHRKVENVVQEQMGVSKADKKKEKRRRKRLARALRKAEEADDITIFRKEAEKVRKQNMVEDSAKDRDEIEMLESKLGLRKKQKQKPVESPADGEQEVEDALKKNAETYVDNLLSALDEDDGDTSTSEFGDADVGSEDENEPTRSDDEEMDREEENEEMCEDEGDEESNEDNEETDAKLENSSASNSAEEDFVSGEGEMDEHGENFEEDEVESDKSLCLDEKILALAKQAKMNTPIKTKIFCTIMSSASSSDSFEQLKNLSLEGPEEREIVYVCIQCALLEAEYNPYYSVLIGKFCELRKQFRLTTQFALWDSMKTLRNLKKRKMDNFVCLFADLLKLNAVGLAVFKAVNFGEETSTEMEFVGRVIHRFLTKAPDAIQRQTFMRLINSNKHQRLTDAIENFLSQWNIEEYKAAKNFSMFERQLGMVKRLFAVR